MNAVKMMTPSDWNETTVALLQRIMDEEVESGRECGCQLAIYHHGRPVVEMSSGYADRWHRRRVDRRTLFPVFSVGKGVMATAFHRLVEKGIIAYDARVADLWPEFGVNGKENIRVWHILSHREALFEMPSHIEPDELADWDRMCHHLAAMSPAWMPGTRCRYHPITYAWLLGEVARRADGRPFDRIIREEVLDPLRLDWYFGTDAEAESRMAELDGSAFPEGNTWHIDFIGNDRIRRGFVPSANGVTTASAIARHYAALLDDVDDVRLLTPNTVRTVTQLRRADDDPIPPQGTWERFGLGYALHGPDEDLGALFGHGGAAGSEGFADRGNHLALGLTRNKISRSHPAYLLRDKISAVLGYPPRHW